MQNAANHCLSRADVEAIIPLFPLSWSSVVKRVLLIRAGNEPIAVFYPKAKELSLSYSTEEGKTNKAQAITELVIALAAVAEKGELPQPLNASYRRQLEHATAELQAKCIGRLR